MTVLLFCGLSSAQAQKLHGANWVWGNGFWVTFSDGTPKKLNLPLLLPFRPGCISSRAGDLLYSTDGIRYFNKDGLIFNKFVLNPSFSRGDTARSLNGNLGIISPSKNGDKFYNIFSTRDKSRLIITNTDAQ